MLQSTSTDLKTNNNSNYIEWIVAIAVALATTFSATVSVLDIFIPLLGKMTGIFRMLILLLLLIYQISHYGIHIKKNKVFAFFILYSTYIFLYITVFPVYKLEDLNKAPSSVVNFFYRTVQIIVYLLCGDVIIKHLKPNKFLIVSFFAAILPSLFFINYIGIDTLQYFGQNRDSDDFISALTFGYANAPLIVVAIVFFKSLFKNKLLSMCSAAIIFVSATFILGAGGERGPIVWTLANIVICLFLMTKHSVRYFFLLFCVGVILILSIDTIINGLEKIAPHTAEKIESTVKEGDTNGRFDMDNPEGSTYILGLKMFASSPIFGSYFRITGNNYFRGNYPHNVFVEILMTMGLIGFIPFVYLLLLGWKAICKTIKGYHTDSQMLCVILFFSNLLELLTSNTLLFNAGFWCFFLIVCNLKVISSFKKK